MLLSLLKTPLAVPLKPSAQLTGRVFPPSTAATRSFSATTLAQFPKKVEPAVEGAKVKRGRPDKVQKSKKNAKESPPRQPNNAYIRFSTQYYNTHEIKQPVPVIAGQIKEQYDKMSLEEKKQFLPTEQEVADYKARRAAWFEKKEEARFKAKLNGYQLYVSAQFPKGSMDPVGEIKDISTKWKALSNDERADWTKRAIDRYTERNRS